nr:peptidase S41 [Pseudopedobacter sp.]
MKKVILSLLLSMVILPCLSQNLSPQFNFDFEQIKNGKILGWDQFGSKGYKMSIDSTNVKSGKYSAAIEFIGKDLNFKAWSFTIPNSYAGKKITLVGYVKTENVTEGYAGLWMRIDPSVAFDNMSSRGIKGTTDWKAYSITLKMNPEETKQIVVGGLLSGNGKIWIDDFKVTIDGKDISNLKPLVQKGYPAENDKEFDQGSGLSFNSLSSIQIENLKCLGQVWGFLKYYHPQIAEGNFNWDYELFRVMPKVISANNKEQLSQVFINWIHNLGNFKSGNERVYTHSDIGNQPDLTWISQSGFSNNLQELLLKVKDAKRPKINYYVNITQVGNPEFKHEQAYASMSYPDVGFRLLSLFRYWNIIQYFYPYKNLINEDWNRVLLDFIPKMIKTKNETSYTLTVLELIGDIHDTHANIWGGNQALNKYFGLKCAPIKVCFIAGKPVVTGFLDQELGFESGLKIGDVIIAVNHQDIDSLLNKRLKYYPASNYPTQLRDFSRDLLRSNDSTIQINYLREGMGMSKNVNTFSIKQINIYGNSENTDTVFRILGGDIAYINNGALKKKDLPEIWKKMKDTKGVIIDDRNYPSDFPLYALGEYLMPKKTAFVKLTEGDIQSPGLFQQSNVLFVGKKNNNYYKGKVVILVNEITQSAAEFNAMAYRVQPKAVVVGSTTAGADGNVSQFYLPGGLSTMISGIGVYYPNGKVTQQVGIVPDIVVNRSIEGVKEGKDELLDKAIELIKGN